MKDTYGDKIDVNSEEGSILLEVHDSCISSAGRAYADLTPKKARKLARRLRAAADEAEGK